MSNTEFSLLHCSICFEEFVKPKALPCLHTFCKICIGEYIQSVAKVSESKVSFPCPLCRKDTHLAVCLDPAENLPDNFIINNLKLASKYEFDSGICNAHGSKAVEYFCSRHELLLCSKCIVSNHRNCSILEISEALETRKQNIRDSQTRVIASRDKMEKLVDSLTKRKRENCINIDQCKTGVKLYVQELRKLLVKAETQMIRKLDELQEKQATSLNKTLSDTGEVLNDIALTLKEIEDANTTDSCDFTKLQNYDRKLSLLEEKIHAHEKASIPKPGYLRFEPNMDLFKTLKQDSSLGRLQENTGQSGFNTRSMLQYKHDHSTSTDIQQRQDGVNSFNENYKPAYRNSTHARGAFTVTTVQNGKISTRTVNDTQDECYHNGQKNREPHYKFEHSSSSKTGVPSDEPTRVYSMKRDDNTTLIGSESRVESQKKADWFLRINPMDISSCNIKTKSDKKACFVTGIAVLQDERTIIADYGNTKLKLYDSDCVIIKEKVFTSEPWSVCLTGNTTFLVSFPSDNLIQNFKLKGDRIITLQDKISTDGRCYGLSYHDNKIVVSVRRMTKSSIFVYNKQGQTLSEIQISSGTNVSEIWYLTFIGDGKNIVYTDESSNLVVCIEWESKKHKWKQDVNQPRGIAVVGRFLCVVSRSSCYLHRFSEMGVLAGTLHGQGAPKGHSCIGANDSCQRVVLSFMNKEELELLTVG